MKKTQSNGELMAQPFTSYEVDNDKKFRNAIAEASKFSDDFRIPFGLILRDFYRSQQAIFMLQGPGKYPAFKNSVRASSLGGDNGRRRSEYDVTKSPYQRAKIKAVGFDYPLLVRSGALSASLLGPNNKGSVAQTTKLSLTFGSTISYGIFHQSDEPRKHLPLRKFLFIGPEAPRFANDDQKGRLERWLGYVGDHVAAQLRKSGLNG